MRGFSKFAMLLAMTTSVVAAPSSLASADQTVYITKTGKKYHESGCRMLKKSRIAIKLSEAKEQGYGACGICH